MTACACATIQKAAAMLLNCYCCLNIFNTEKSVGGHVKSL